MIKYLLSFSIITILSTNSFSQYTCELEKRDGYYAEGGSRLTLVYPKPKSNFKIIKLGEFNYEVEDSTGCSIKKGIKQIIQKPNDLLLIQNLDNNWGVYDCEMKVIIKDEYEDLFYETIEPKFRCLIKKDQLWGISDSLNNIIVSIDYDNIQLLTNKVAFLEKGNQKFLFFFENDKLYELENCCVKSGNGSIDPKAILIKQGSLYGAINTFGELIIEPIYDDLKYIEFIKNKNEFYFQTAKGNKIGLIDKFGKEIVRTKYENIRKIIEDENLDSSVFILEENEKKYIVYSGKTSKEHFSEIKTVINSKNNLLIVRKFNMYGVYDLSQHRLSINNKYEDIIPFQDSRLIAKQNGKYGIITSNDKVLLKFKYDIKPELISKSKYYPENCIKIRKNGLFGYANENYEIILKPKYHVLKGFSENVARVMKNDKWGYVDEAYKEIIKLQYEYAEEFKNQQATVIKEGVEITINKDGVIENE